MTKTSSFYLSLLKQEQYKSFFHLIQSNRNRLEDFFAGLVSKTNTLEETHLYCQVIEKHIKNKAYFPYLIIEKETDQLVGLIDVKNIDWSIPKAELGAFIDTNYEGKGIITNYGKELIDQIVSEHHFKKLLCRAAPRNTRSIDVILRLGFILEGTVFRDYKTTKGELADLNYYGKVFD